MSSCFTLNQDPSPGAKGRYIKETKGARTATAGHAVKEFLGSLDALDKNPKRQPQSGNQAAAQKTVKLYCQSITGYMPMKIDQRSRAAVCTLACAKLLALGLYHSAASAAPSITWQPDAINQEILAGATVTLRASFVASGEIQDAILRVVPSLAHYVRAVQVYPEAGATIQPNDPVQVTLSVSVPQDMEPVTLNGVVQLKSAGKSNKTYAKPLPVTLNVRPPKGLPPDPGEAGKTTLLGIDSNNNGVRDDVERYVVLENRDKPELVPLLLSYAALTQEAFRRHGQGEAQPESHLDSVLLHLDCTRYVASSQGGERSLAMMDVVTNTPERWITKLKIDKEIAGGKGISLKKLTEEECQHLLVFPSG